MTNSTRTIGGKVHYLPRIGLIRNSTLYVILEDVSRADVPAKKLASQIIPNAEVAGLSFNLEYDDVDVIPGHSYAISAHIKTDDRLIFTTTERHSVELGVDYLQPLEILVHLV
ncbi:YbaY family lipoprotein [Pseudomonas sp. N3-W]|uniref:YbaY family lipoprotein n=1 Tax=Pseudomonas fungipugnans TaxID=3024217 RepID=A0ABT6QSZ1_9PSED|nr:MULTISPECIES: YbaY family lipoprotein [unclassified Pseudomonas]MDI2594022.1 YbaY family lipoprotein [Pseudomonas sp. 681]UWF50459.1 YbaY family lipoprotein [Pseudomonas sp. N3-W]